MNRRECPDFHKVSKAAIHAGLHAQRLENERLLAKLHTDQKAFVKISKHYERKHAKLKQSTAQFKAKNDASQQMASGKLQKLLREHQSEIFINQNETMRSQVVKGALWKAVSTNTRFIEEVHSQNKKIDCFRKLIASKSQQIQNQKLQTHAKTKSSDDDDCKTKESRTATAIAKGITSAPPDLLDPRQMYARQLIAKNKRYKEVLALLRKKVDVLRAQRKNMIDI